MDNLQRIKTTSRRIKKTCSGLIFCLPLLLAIQWFFFNHLPLLRNLPFIYGIPDYLPSMTRFLACLVEMIPLSVVLYGLLRLRELFLLYENGMIFTEKNVFCFRSLGRVLILWVICHVIKTPLLSSVLIMNDPPGPIKGVLTLEPAHFVCIFVGLVILTITWVMDEARKIQEDQTLFI